MKKLIPLFTFTFVLHLVARSAVPMPPWTVDTARAQPAQFEAYQGETLTFEAALTCRGKPIEAPSNYSFFWQTNGMGRYYWEAPAKGEAASSPLVGTNILFATWLPSYDCGAKVYNCFIGSPSNNYHAAFQLRLRPSPGATPNALPLPTPVIDFARVRVLNPPWSGGGVDTNAVRDIVREQLATNGIRAVDGAARPLPKYLHIYETDDSYPDAAAEYYRQRGSGVPAASCSSVRSGGFLYRNFDFPFDDRAEFVVKMSSGPNRFASVGVAQVGTNLTEQMVTSGDPKYSRLYKWLPGATVDGINENGVVAEINVVDGTPPRRLGGDIHPLGAVRWALDNGTSAEMVATSLAARVQFTAGWTQNFHWMIADATETWIVENGVASNVTAVAAKRVMTNFPILPDTYSGMGKERYQLLRGGEPITNAWFTRAYSPTADWRSEFKTIDEQNTATNGWALLGTMEARRATGAFWQSVHTSIYDLTNRTLRVAVQEVDDWYVFAVPSSGAKVDTNAVIDIANATIETNDTIKALSSSVSGLQSSKLDGPTDPSLTLSGKAADARLTGVALTNRYTKAEMDAKLAGKIGAELDEHGWHIEDSINIAGDVDASGDVKDAHGNILDDKADRPTSYNPGNIAVLNENGNLADGGIRVSQTKDLKTTGDFMIIDDVDEPITSLLTVKDQAEIADDRANEAFGLAAELSENKADADDLDQHVEDSNVHVNLTEKESWNAKADADDVRTLNEGYQRLYAFSAGATNANISVTNYPPTAAEAEGRTHFDPTDPDLDFSTVPASMRLDETRDGVKRTVVDTRDFTVWWWFQKAPKLLASAKGYAEEKCAALFSRLAAWADRTARGLENPAGESTLVVDVPNIWLMTDQTFEKHVAGSNSCWVIRSKNAAVSTTASAAGFLELTDAFGAPYIRFNKTEATFADPPATGIRYDDEAGEWLITYTTENKPKGGANLEIQGSADYPGKAILKEEGDELCPAVITWTGSSRNWVMHAKPKQIAGADPDKMFFGAVVEVEGQDYIEYLKPVSFSHIVMPNGAKIAPDVPASASVGSTVEWKVVQ